MYLYTALFGLMTGVVAQSTVDYSQHVLTSNGEASGGNTFPGVSLPFGMVKLGPDMFTGSDSYSGAALRGNFTGFSMMHESGTGGSPKYGVVSQMPILGNITNPLVNLNDTRASADITSVGYYKASLGSNITVELGATSRAGFYQYTFPEGRGTPNVVVDVSHVLPSYRKQGLSQNYLGGNITVLEDGHYEGSGDYNNGWNMAPDWRIYFCGYFESPATTKTFTGTSLNGSAVASYDTERSASSKTRLGAVFSFNTTTVVSRVGISFMSSAQACENVNSQIPSGTTLSTLTNDAKNVWNTEVLSKVTTTETNKTNLQLLYSSLYFMHLLPSNRTGENPLWISSEPYYDDTFTTWDLFRCTFSLLHILQPVAYEEYIRSLIDIFRFEGYMPDARSSNFNGAIQGGTNSDNVLADAYVKGVRGAVNWTTGYQAMVKDAEVTPANNNDPRDNSSSTKEGRGALPDWLQHGYITPKYGRSVSRAVEYSFNDFSLYQVATGLGIKDDAMKYLKRSRYWVNHWNPNATSLGFNGFLVPRSALGFIKQDPLSCGGCYWGDAYYEALPWEYSFNMHHDMNTLIALSGGPSTFVNRLDTMFKPGINTSGRSSAFNNTIFNPGNEPSFTTPYLYNYVGRQDLSVMQSRYIAKSYYSPTPGGLPGNSDAGAMESWLIWNMLGLYPMVGQTTFLIGSPWFANTTIQLGGGKTLAMTTVNGSESSFYVQSLKVNGKPWNQSWLTWNDVFANGGTMDFVLGSQPSNWTTGPAPPSPASMVSDTADPNSILTPVPTAPDPKSHNGFERERKKAMMRMVAFVILAITVVTISCAGIWHWRKRNATTKVDIVDQEKGPKQADVSARENESSSKGYKQNLMRWIRWIPNGAPKRDLNRSITTKNDVGSISEDTMVDMKDSDNQSPGKAPMIKVKGVHETSSEEALEPWTPSGTNRRTFDERS
ncbi:putative glycosyl hydrolase protein [Botrytis cinerea BcDW1]|uniref:Glycoside hydrolase family 92 protein n=2 Tax=Botryotinia fuckeliana TaxID=40559 RepID=G2Y0H1_BOTF4|nr:putative glycosyl hydrolase protein [Botrytis cinerea BcDW1]CCD46136.1 glycoside hydrolase family 92 protein [Botrytis cinerea T4]